jgi:hypothetical protein
VQAEVRNTEEEINHETHEREEIKQRARKEE